MKNKSNIYNLFIVGRKQEISLNAFIYSNIFLRTWFDVEIYYSLYYDMLFIADMVVIVMIMICV